MMMMIVMNDYDSDDCGDESYDCDDDVDVR